MKNLGALVILFAAWEMFGRKKKVEGVVEGFGAEYFHPSVVQTLLFPKDQFNMISAANWAKSKGYKHSDVEFGKQGKYVRLRQFPPSNFRKDSFRVIDFGKGIRAIIADAKSEALYNVMKGQRKERTKKAA